MSLSDTRKLTQPGSPTKVQYSCDVYGLAYIHTYEAVRCRRPFNLWFPFGTAVGTYVIYQSNQQVASSLAKANFYGSKMARRPVWIEIPCGKPSLWSEEEFISVDNHDLLMCGYWFKSWLSIYPLPQAVPLHTSIPYCSVTDSNTPTWLHDLYHKPMGF